MRFLLGRVVRVTFGIEQVGLEWEVHRDSVRLKDGIETIRRRVLARCDSQQEAEVEMHAACSAMEPHTAAQRGAHGA